MVELPEARNDSPMKEQLRAMWVWKKASPNGRFGLKVNCLYACT